MDHLTQEQIEQVLQGELDADAHLQSCPDCRQRVVEARAIQRRLRGAFSTLQTSDNLAERIRISVHQASTQTASPKRFVFPRRVLSRIAAAAVLLLLVLPGALYLTTGNRAEARQMELMQIHHRNLAGDNDFIRCSDPNTPKEHFLKCPSRTVGKDQVGAHLPVYGCCVRTYGGEEVPTYVVKTPEGLVTVLTLDESPQWLGMHRAPQLSQPGSVIWTAVCECCNMAARRIGDKTYYAMGQVSHASLAPILADSPDAN